MPHQELRHLKTHLSSVAEKLTKITKAIDSSFEKMKACFKDERTLFNFQAAVEAYHDELSEYDIKIRTLLHNQVV